MLCVLLVLLVLYILNRFTFCKEHFLSSRSENKYKRVKLNKNELNPSLYFEDFIYAARITNNVSNVDMPKPTHTVQVVSYYNSLWKLKFYALDDTDTASITDYIKRSSYFIITPDIYLEKNHSKEVLLAKWLYDISVTTENGKDLIIGYPPGNDTQGNDTHLELPNILNNVNIIGSDESLNKMKQHIRDERKFACCFPRIRSSSSTDDLCLKINAWLKDSVSNLNLNDVQSVKDTYPKCFHN